MLPTVSDPAAPLPDEAGGESARESAVGGLAYEPPAIEWEDELVALTGCSTDPCAPACGPPWPPWCGG